MQDLKNVNKDLLKLVERLEKEIAKEALYEYLSNKQKSALNLISTIQQTAMILDKMTSGLQTMKNINSFANNALEILSDLAVDIDKAENSFLFFKSSNKKYYAKLYAINSLILAVATTLEDLSFNIRTIFPKIDTFIGINQDITLSDLQKEKIEGLKKILKSSLTNYETKNKDFNFDFRIIDYDQDLILQDILSTKIKDIFLL